MRRGCRLMSEPLVLSGQWRVVMRAAGFRCQCTGQCGKTHADGQGRCPREHDRYTDARQGPARLIAAPAELFADARQAVQVPHEQLRAWCERCYGNAVRRARKDVRDSPWSGQGVLFDIG